MSVPKSFAAVQSKIRALATKLVPAKVARAFARKDARRVAATDAKTDTGKSYEATMDTKATRVAGPRSASDKKTLKVVR